LRIRPGFDEVTAMGSTVAIAEERLPLEPKGRDFPYYRGGPPTISTTGWLPVLAGVAAGFLALTTPLPLADNLPTGWPNALLFVCLPLLGLWIASPRGWTAIFARIGSREVKLMFVFALLNIIITSAIGGVIKFYGTTTSNTAIVDAALLGGVQLLNFFAKVALQLLGEELITILPFLAVLAFAHAHAGIGRNASVIVAWLVSAVAFGLIHLPTYDWNLMQCLVVIGSARLILTWAYIWSKNVWVSTGAHIINDWTLTALTIFLTSLAAPV
jgi:membrane protease YdiL (CAAX protease family)